MNNPRPVRFAIMGAGMVARYHRDAIEACREDGAALSAIVHHDPSRFAAVGEQFGVPCISEEEMLADAEIDAVCVCTPSGQHAEQAVAAARAGKHLLVEKPLALTLGDADRIIDACRRSGVKLGVAFQRRAEPLFQRIRQAIQAGDLGDLTLATVTLPYLRKQAYYDSAPWRGTWALDGGGVLMNQGIHLLDLLVWYAGDPTGVSAYAGTLHREIEVEDIAGAVFRFPNGAVGTLAATTATEPGFSHRLELYGTRGAIVVEGEAVTRWTLAEPEQARVLPYEVSAPAGAGSGADPRGLAPTAHARLLRDFVQSIREDRPPVCSGEEGRRSLAAVLAIYEAAGIGPSVPQPMESLPVLP